MTSKHKLLHNLVICQTCFIKFKAFHMTTDKAVDKAHAAYNKHMREAIQDQINELEKYTNHK